MNNFEGIIDNIESWCESKNSNYDALQSEISKLREYYVIIHKNANMLQEIVSQDCNMRSCDNCYEVIPDYGSNEESIIELLVDKIPIDDKDFIENFYRYNIGCMCEDCFFSQVKTCEKCNEDFIYPNESKKCILCELLNIDREIYPDTVEEEYIPEINLEYASEHLRDNQKIVTELVKLNGNNLEYASTRLQDNREIVLAAVKNCSRALKFASERLRDDYDIVLAAIRNIDETDFCFDIISERLRNDRDIVYEGAKNGFYVLKYVPERFGDDQAIALLSVKSRGSNLEYLSPRLRDDPDLVLEAISQNKNNIIFASERIQKIFIK